MRNQPLKFLRQYLSGLLPALTALLLIGGNLSAQTVATIGGDLAGNLNGNTLSTALFNKPCGLALDPSGTFMLVADYNNNAVRLVSKVGVTASSITSLFAGTNNAVNHPIGIVIDASTNIYVVNRGNGTNNGTVQHFGGLYLNSGTIIVYPALATNLPNATAIAIDGFTNLYVTIKSNTVLRINPFSGSISTVGVITNAGTALQGIAVLDDGTLAMSDSGNNGIWVMNPFGNITNNSVKLTGFHGASDTNGPSWAVSFRQPAGISKAGGGKLIVADYGNHKYKIVDVTSGSVSLLYGVTSNLWVGGQSGIYPGWKDGAAGTTSGSAESRLPYGVVVASDGSVYTSEIYYHLLRHVTATGLSAPSLGYPPLFSGPAGIALDSSATSLYIADTANNAVQLLNLANNKTTTYLNGSSGISSPASVLLDTNNNLYVLNGGANGSIISFDPYSNFIATNAVGLTNPTAFTIDLNGNIFVAEQGGKVKAVFQSGAVNTIATVTNSGVSLQGIAIFDDGSIAVSDAGNHVIWTINSITKVINRLTGQLGSSGTTFGASNVAKLFMPHQMVRDAGNRLIVADSGNNRLVTVTRSGSITNSLNSTNALVWFGNANDPVGTNSTRFVPMVSPIGLAVAINGTVYTSEPFYSDIRGLQNTSQSPPLTTPNVILPFFIAPTGIAFDPLGDALFIADAANNTIDLLNLNNNLTSTFLSASDGVSQPASVLVDTNENIYVLNQNGGSNGDVSMYDIYGNFLGNAATGLTQPTAFLLDGYGKLFITEQAGKVRVFNSDGTSNLVATVTNANVSLQGISAFDDGTIAVSDAGNHVIWGINPITKLISKITGQLGTNGTTLGASNFAKLYQPHQLTRGANNKLVISDYANNRLVTVTRAGSITNVLNSTNANLWFGQTGDPIATGTPKFVSMILPSGVTVGSDGTVYASETFYDDIRGITGANVGAPTATPGIPLPVYSAPAGIALNQLANLLFITDPTNNTVSVLNLVNNQTTVFLDGTSGISQPVDVAVDNTDNLYVLNQGTGGNGSILKFDKYGNLVGTNASFLSLPTAMKLSIAGDLYVSELGGLVQKFPAAGGSNTVANINTNGNVQLQGVALLDNGSVVVSDAGNHVIWKIAPGATNAVILTGILGTPGSTLGASGTGKLNKPMRLAQAKGGLFIIADSGNNRVVVADNLGTISSVLNSTNATLWFGLPVDPVATNSPIYVPMVAPIALAIGNSGTVFVSENTYKDIRGVLGTALKPAVTPPSAPQNLVAAASFGQIVLTWTATINATNYIVSRSPSTGGSYTTLVGTTSQTTLTDTNIISGTTYYYVVAASNEGGVGPNSTEAFATTPLPPVPNPQIGYIDFPATSTPIPYTSVFHPISSFIFNNDAYVVMLGQAGSQTFYTYGITMTNQFGISTNPPDPTSASSSAPVGYQDGMSGSQVASFAVGQILPDVTFKAIGEKNDGSPNSAIVQARLQFVTANPSINGGNAASFTISDITTNAHLYYTTDGSSPSPTNPAATDLGVLSGTNTQWSVSLNIQSNTLFEARAFKNNYQPSAVVFNQFAFSAYQPTKITFGTSAGEPRSQFLARPGQFFYAPVTLQLPSGFGKMYSLQFNIAVTNGYTNVYNGNSIPAVASTSNYLDFFPMLMTSVKPDEGRYFPPADGSWYLPIPPLLSYVNSGITNFVPSMFINTNNNLLGIGWLYRTGIKYTAVDTNGITDLDFDTTKQDLIAYSIAHDTLFSKANGLVVVGAYAFQIPTNSVNGDQYFIQLGSPSATADGVGAPGAGIYIKSPDASQSVTVTSPSYLVGDAAPFHWLNAGDFGDTNLDNSDVMQVYQSAILGVNMPPLNSDLYASMDSSGGFAAFDTSNGYYTNSQNATFLQQQAMWDGNDLTINTNAFGDGNLDINDVYVTFRRSLDPSLLWFTRIWTNGQFIAVTTPNLAFNTNTPHILTSKLITSKAVTKTADFTQSSINFSAGDFVGSAGGTATIPISANILGSYPLRVLGLNITVEPLDGSPSITNQISFIPSAALGSPSLPSVSKGADNFNGAWLNSSIAGLSNNATLGTLTMTLPPNATSSSAYAVHFDFASGSPNGLALFPNTKFTGLVTTSARTNSYYNDGIPDSWRLRWFGTIYNSLSQSNASASGDGINNWNKFIAGVDPTQPGNFPKVNPKSAPSGYTAAIHWPSVQSKKYVIERSSTLFGGSWSVLTTNTGTGGDVEYDDTYTNKVKFYRVRILP